MRTFIVLALFVAAAVAVPVEPKDAVIVKQVLDNIGLGEYNYGYESSDGKSASESGILKNVGTEQEAIEVRGSFSYIGVDGQNYVVNYIANELGFQPSGAHIPV